MLNMLSPLSLTTTYRAGTSISMEKDDDQRG